MSSPGGAGPSAADAGQHKRPIQDVLEPAAPGAAALAAAAPPTAVPVTAAGTDDAPRPPAPAMHAAAPASALAAAVAARAASAGLSMGPSPPPSPSSSAGEPSSSGAPHRKRRRTRRTFSDANLLTLQREYNANSLPSSDEVARIVASLAGSETSVRVEKWFSNQRQRAPARAAASAKAGGAGDAAAAAAAASVKASGAAAMAVTAVAAIAAAPLAATQPRRPKASSSSLAVKTINSRGSAGKHSKIGRRCEVYWDGDLKWYSGWIVDRHLQHDGKRYLVQYDDGQKQWELGSSQRFHLLPLRLLMTGDSDESDDEAAGAAGALLGADPASGGLGSPGPRGPGPAPALVEFPSQGPSRGRGGGQLICELCKAKHDGGKGSGRFCSIQCARRFSGGHGGSDSPFRTPDAAETAGSLSAPAAAQAKSIDKMTQPELTRRLREATGVGRVSHRMEEGKFLSETVAEQKIRLKKVSGVNLQMKGPTPSPAALLPPGLIGAKVRLAGGQLGKVDSVSGQYLLVKVENSDAGGLPILEAVQFDDALLLSTASGGFPSIPGASAPSSSSMHRQLPAPQMGASFSGAPSERPSPPAARSASAAVPMSLPLEAARPLPPRPQQQPPPPRQQKVAPAASGRRINTGGEHAMRAEDMDALTDEEVDGMKQLDLIPVLKQLTGLSRVTRNGVCETVAEMRVRLKDALARKRIGLETRVNSSADIPIPLQNLMSAASQKAADAGGGSGKGGAIFPSAKVSGPNAAMPSDSYGQGTILAINCEGLDPFWLCMVKDVEKDSSTNITRLKVFWFEPLIQPGEPITESTSYKVGTEDVVAPETVVCPVRLDSTSTALVERMKSTYLLTSDEFKVCVNHNNRALKVWDVAGKKA